VAATASRTEEKRNQNRVERMQKWSSSIAVSGKTRAKLAQA
jgi:hypothetical protein